jgi:type II secretory pathway pseudopilin PulG
MKHPMALARATRSQAGFALIEVIVSAAVLAMMALAVLAGIDGASASTATEKARTVASGLAEADQERLRGLPVTTLAQYAATAPYLVSDPAGPPFSTPNPAGTTKTVDGVNYQVVSKAQWVRDDTGDSVTCTSKGSADYFHITSTVTSSIIGKRTAPVTIDSIYAPNVAYSSTRGTLAVQVLDAKGNPVVGKLVTVTGGTPPPPALTNSMGCAVFQQLPVDAAGTTYTATLNTQGYVDPSGNTLSSQNATVTPGGLSLLTMSYDLAASVDAAIKTYKPGSTAAAPGSPVGSAAAQVSAVTSGATGKLFPFPVPGGTETGSISATGLYPFPQKYTFFTGSCHYNDPTDTIYGSANTANPNGALLAGQQVAAPGAATVFQPPLNYQLAGTDRNRNSPPANQMTVKLTPVAPNGDACAQPPITLKTINVGTATNPKWMVGRLNAGGQLDAGVPYGNYTMCFQDGAYKWSPGSYANPSGSASYYDNTTPPTGQPSAQSGSPTRFSWGSGTC